jgi:hypothetical protein
MTLVKLAIGPPHELRLTRIASRVENHKETVSVLAWGKPASSTPL